MSAEEPPFSPIGQRVMRPSKHRPRPDLCAGLGHPGATFNAREDLTWCLCGAVITEGDTSVPHVSCCGGPLEEVV